jgi:hypothetical protein
MDMSASATSAMIQRCCGVLDCMHGVKCPLRDPVHAPAKRSVVIPDATHLVLFEKNRFHFFEEVLQFLKQQRRWIPAGRPFR